MRAAIAIAAAFAAVANAFPQGVTQAIAPPAPAPAGCSPSASGTFQITVVNVTNVKRSLERRDVLTLTLNGGVLKDAQGRTGYIASNYQFQFDGPPQAGALYTAGFSLCQNGTLALGGSAIWYQCLSGDFYNLYDRHWAAQCNAIYLYSMGASSGGSAAAGPGPVVPPASQRTDGQPIATSGGAAPVSALSDGQPQAPTGRPISQISDGQIQNPTGRPITQISDGQIQNPTGRPITQISDGQIQNPTGSVRATTSMAAISQISDGQIQAPRPTGSPVMQISDGQIQASPRPGGPPVSQISDGQIQAPTSRPASSTARPVSQISDGQIQAAASATSSVRASSTGVAVFTGAAVPLKKGDAIAVVAGVAAALAML